MMVVCILDAAVQDASKHSPEAVTEQHELC